MHILSFLSHYCGSSEADKIPVQLKAKSLIIYINSHKYNQLCLSHSIIIGNVTTVCIKWCYNIWKNLPFFSFPFIRQQCATKIFSRDPSDVIQMRADSFPAARRHCRASYKPVLINVHKSFAWADRKYQASVLRWLVIRSGQCLNHPWTSDLSRQ